MQIITHRGTIFQWSTDPFKYLASPYTWNDVITVIEAVEAVRGAKTAEDLQDWLKKEPEKKKKLIKLLCKIQGKEYEEEKYIKENIGVTVRDIELLAKEVLQIEIKISETEK